MRIFSTSEQASEAAIFSCLNRRLTRIKGLGTKGGRKASGKAFFRGKISGRLLTFSTVKVII